MIGFFVAGLAVLALAGIAAPALRRWASLAATVFSLLVATGCALVALPALHVLTGGAAWQVSVLDAAPGGPWLFGIDPLSAFFLLVIAGVGATAAVYGVSYMKPDAGRSAAPFSHAAVVALVVSMMLVVTARAAVPFLAALELMVVSAFLLVMTDHAQAEVRRAGLVYLAAAHAATLTLVALFAVWGARGPDLTFGSLAATAAASGSGFRTALLLIALLGFGLKAGLVPVHFWLPGAHAAAPSHVSALMSGLLIKTGIYGLLRVAALLGGVPAWYGWTLLGLGVVSGVLGVVWALAQHDLKRLLAYHSVENIGIIVIGMGAGALGTVYDRPDVAMLGYVGALLHVLNHGLFKSLLFLGAGAVARATGTRTMDALGGLARHLPLTWLAFLVGSAAIVGLPPLNGFVSEWAIALSLLHAGAGTGAIRVAVLGLGGLGLIGGLALACFAKVNGVVFLGRARSPGAAAARDVDGGLSGPPLALAAVCVVIGLAPWLVVPAAARAAQVVTGTGAMPLDGFSRTVARLSLAAMALVLAAVVAWLLRAGAMRGRSRSVDHVWGCGLTTPTSRQQYTAASFAAPVLEPFGALTGVRAESAAGRFVTHPHDLVLDGAVRLTWSRLGALAARLRVMQAVRLHNALLYVLATVVAVLAYLALWTGP